MRCIFLPEGYKLHEIYLNTNHKRMLSKEATLAIIELNQWYAHEKLIEFTTAYERGDKSRYRDMVRMEELIKVLKTEEKSIETGRRI